MDFKGVHWIELVEFYLEPLSVLLEPVVERILSGFTDVTRFFRCFLAVK